MTGAQYHAPFNHSGLRQCAFSVATLAVISSSALPAQDAGGPPPTTAISEIRTSASATRTVPPNLAIGVFEFSGRGPTLAAASQVTARIGDAVRKALVGAGVPSDSVTSRGFVNYYWDERSSIEVKQNPLRPYNPDTVYTYRDVLVARMRDTKNVGRAIDAAVGAGAQKLSSLRFVATDVEKANEEILTEATRRARRKAELMAEAAGGRLGRLIAVSTDFPSEATRSDFVLRESSAMSVTQPTAVTNVTPPQIEIRSIVYTRWEFLPGQTPR
jgi:uncharacterized protein YggE